jgi:hypothetical protein
MHHSRVLKATAAVLMLILLAAGCGGGDDKKASADGDKTAFCKTNSSINSDLQKATSPEQVLDVFKKFEPQFDDYVKNAPAEVKSDAQLQVSKARAFVKDNDPQKLLTEDKDLTKAGEKVDSFCGVKSGSSGSDSSSDKSTSSDSSDSSTSSAKGSGATCEAFAQIQGFSQVSAEAATKDWSEIQALFASKKDEIKAAYDKIAANAPADVAADVQLISKFTTKLIDAAASASSVQEWAQLVGADPDAQAAGAAGARMATFAQNECGIDPTGVSS